MSDDGHNGDRFPVEVEGLVARYGERTVLSGVDFAAERGRITVVIGGSGCGKSTLLRHALGLLAPAAGRVRLFGRDLTEATDEDLRRMRMRIGVLFQNGALFTSMTVGENVAMVIRENSALPEEIIAEIVRMKLSLVGLGEAVHLFPEELSGGMRKRAALARALASDPDVLFCDEPSAGLDPVVAAGLDDLLLTLKGLFDMTMIVVTHEIESIKKIADRVVMLDDGAVVAEGTLDAVRSLPDPRVCDFFDRVSHAAKGPRGSLLALVREEAG